MDWTEETISRLRSLWQEGLSTAEIGRRMSITKNAVVGKAHRLTLPARPSPIRKPAADAAPRPDRIATFAPRPPAAPNQDNAGPVLRPAVADGMATGGCDPHRGTPGNVTPLRAAPRPSADAAHESAPPPAIAGREPRHTVPPTASRPASSPPPRRYNQSCCWPLGDPGTRQFHFCGGDPIPGKPYCAEHAQLAYVKLKDRRDTVA